MKARPRHRVVGGTVERTAAAGSAKPPGRVRQVLAQTGRVSAIREEGQVEGFGHLLLELFHLPRRGNQARLAVRAVEYPLVSAAAGGCAAVAGHGVSGLREPLSHFDPRRGCDRIPPAGRLALFESFSFDHRGRDVGGVCRCHACRSGSGPIPVTRSIRVRRRSIGSPVPQPMSRALRASSMRLDRPPGLRRSRCGSMDAAR